MDSINPLWLVIFTAAIALIPVLIGLSTAYVKISIVLGMVRSALGTQQVPSSMVVMALSFAMTIYVMAPVITDTFNKADSVEWAKIQSSPNLQRLKSLSVLVEPWRNFMKQHAGKREMAVLNGLSEFSPKDRQGSTAASSQNMSAADDNLRVLLPAFVLTELKEAFAMAFVLLLPFLVIDLIVANILVGMGMYMVSPVMISLPLKLILFVVSDAWLLLSKGLILSYQL